MNKLLIWFRSQFKGACPHCGSLRIKDGPGYEGETCKDCGAITFNPAGNEAVWGRARQ